MGKVEKEGRRRRRTMMKALQKRGGGRECVQCMCECVLAVGTVTITQESIIYLVNSNDSKP